MQIKKSSFIRLLAAVIIYTVFAFYIYQPHFEDFERFDFLLIPNLILAATGCYILSRRWILSFTCSVLAGIIYGFSPMLLSLARFHPTAGTIAAATPWLFCIPAYIPLFTRQRWTQAPLSVVPFLAILGYFEFAAAFSLFPAPLQIKPSLQTLASLLVPTAVAVKSELLFSIYHIPVAGFLIGLWLFIETRRYGISLIIIAGLVLAFSNNLTVVSPAVWLMIPLLCIAIITAEGLSAFLNATSLDFEWLAGTAGILAVCSAASFMLSIKYYKFFAGLARPAGDTLATEARLFLLGSVCIAVITIISKLNLRLKPVRLLLIIVPCLLDFLITSTAITDKIL